MSNSADALQLNLIPTPDSDATLVDPPDPTPSRATELHTYVNDWRWGVPSLRVPVTSGRSAPLDAAYDMQPFHSAYDPYMLALTSHARTEDNRNRWDASGFLSRRAENSGVIHNSIPATLTPRPTGPNHTGVFSGVHDFRMFQETTSPGSSSHGTNNWRPSPLSTPISSSYNRIQRSSSPNPSGAFPPAPSHPRRRQRNPDRADGIAEIEGTCISIRSQRALSVRLGEHSLTISFPAPQEQRARRGNGGARL